MCIRDRAEGVEKLDYVIGTHPHSDHIGGLDKVIDTFPVDRVCLLYTSYLLYIFSICQSTGIRPCSVKNELVLLTGLLPKNPLDADSGLGWLSLIHI